MLLSDSCTFSIVSYGVRFILSKWHFSFTGSCSVSVYLSKYSSFGNTQSAGSIWNRWEKMSHVCEKCHSCHSHSSCKMSTWVSYKLFIFVCKNPIQYSNPDMSFFARNFVLWRHTRFSSFFFAINCTKFISHLIIRHDSQCWNWFGRSRCTRFYKFIRTRRVKEVKIPVRITFG